MRIRNRLAPSRQPAALIGVVLASLLAATGATSTLAADADGFEQADRPWAWSFPRDHGRHDGFRTEWWYFTGNLRSAEGAEFGYQLTFFRSGLAPGRDPQPQGDDEGRASPWATRSLYLAHAHVSDITGRRYARHDRIARGRPGLAEASDQTLDVSLLDWSARLREDGVIELTAHEPGAFAINLQAVVERGPIFQGPGGLSPKGNAPGHGSHYYSFTRLRTTGTLTFQDEVTAVSGLTWMDHEFSSKQLMPDQVGWDWFSLQMNDGTDLMVYRLRRADGSTDFAFATRVSDQGVPTYFRGAERIGFEASEPWVSRESGGAYPQRWRLHVDDLPVIEVRSRFPEQEMVTDDSTGISYWEGAVEALDAQGQVIGRGYMELTGYAEHLGGVF